MQKEEENLKVLAVSPCFSLIAVFENRHFAFTTREQSADIFLVSENNQQGNSDSKNSVGNIVYIKNDQDKNREGHACQYGTKGYKTGQVKDHQKNGYTAQGS